MSSPDARSGWEWFEPGAATAGGPDALARSAAMCLQTPQGRFLLRHLESAFLERRVPPTASDAELRHAEGQRSVVSHLLRLVARGRQPAPAFESSTPAAGVSP